MDTATATRWDAFVVSAWPGLVRTATLLTADPGAAGALAEAALVRIRRRWRVPDADPDGPGGWQERARQVLLTLPATPGFRLRNRVRRSLGLDREPGDEPESVLGRYRSLEPRQRALLVLTVADGLDVSAAGALLALPAAAAEHEVAAAVDALRVPSSDGLVELDLGDRSGAAAVDALLSHDLVAGDLREAFARLAAASPIADDVPRRVDLALVMDRRSRRRRALVAACLAVAPVVGIGGVAREHSRAEAERVQLAAERAVDAALHPQVLDADLSSWPTRGSLARDPQLLADVRARISGGPVILFVGDVAGVDAAVAITGAGEAPLLHVLAGPPGSPVDTWRAAGDELFAGPGATPAVSAAIRDGQGRLHLLTVTLTAGVAVSYSPAPVLADDASVARRYVRMPLTDGVGAALVSAAPDRLRMRVDSAGGAAILRPLVVPPLYVAADVVPPLQVPVTRAASCRGAREVEDVPRIVEEATREASLSGSDVTSVRMLWCRRDGTRGEAALALGARQGPDIQCYQLDRTAPDDSYETARQCWPVPRGAGTSTPFLAPALPVPGSQGNDLPVTVHAPGAAFAELQAAPAGSPTVARARVDPDGYGRFVATGMPAAPRDVLAREGAITLLDGSRHMISILLVSSRHPSDVWGEAVDGPVREP